SDTGYRQKDLECGQHPRPLPPRRLRAGLQRGDAAHSRFAEAAGRRHDAGLGSRIEEMMPLGHASVARDTGTSECTPRRAFECCTECWLKEEARIAEERPSDQAQTLAELPGP